MLITSTPSGRDISWLYRLFVVRLRRQALCKFVVHGLLFGVGGELNMSKVNWDVSIGDAELASVSAEVKSKDNTDRREISRMQKDYDALLMKDTALRSIRMFT